MVRGYKNNKNRKVYKDNKSVWPNTNAELSQGRFSPWTDNAQKGAVLLRAGTQATAPEVALRTWRTGVPVILRAWVVEAMLPPDCLVLWGHAPGVMCVFRSVSRETSPESFEKWHCLDMLLGVGGLRCVPRTLLGSMYKAEESWEPTWICASWQSQPWDLREEEGSAEEPLNTEHETTGLPASPFLTLPHRLPSKDCLTSYLGELVKCAFPFSDWPF